jgi:hypothetical protein
MYGVRRVIRLRASVSVLRSYAVTSRNYAVTRMVSAFRCPAYVWTTVDRMVGWVDRMKVFFCFSPLYDIETVEWRKEW